jgi:hypothetical protein
MGIERLLTWPLEYALGLDIGKEKKKPVEPRDIDDILKDLYDYAWGHLDVRVVTVMVPKVDGEYKYESEEERTLIDDLAAEKVVRQWAREHGGPETAQLSMFIGMLAVDFLAHDPKYAQDYKNTPAVSITCPKGFADLLWLYFKKNFPPYAKKRYYAEANRAGRDLDELQRVIGISRAQGLHAANKRSRKS